MTPFLQRRTRRALTSVALLIPTLALAAGCGGGFDNGTQGGSGGSGGSAQGKGSVVIVGQKFTEADILTQLYQGLLEHAGFDTSVKNLGTRDVYLKPLENGDVQVSADYLSSMTEALNRQVNGEDATPIASPNPATTLNELEKLGEKVGLTPLKPAKATDQNAFAVTKEFAKQHHLSTLSDLGKLGRPVSLAANSDCKARSDCAKGLESVYGIKISKIEPLGFDSPQSKQAAVDGEVDVAQVATTDATLDQLGLVILTDDKNWQNAENLVPIVNTNWLQDHTAARSALNSLSTVLTTSALARMNAKVDAQRMQASDVAHTFLEQNGLLG